MSTTYISLHNIVSITMSEPKPMPGYYSFVLALMDECGEEVEITIYSAKPLEVEHGTTLVERIRRAAALSA